MDVHSSSIYKIINRIQTVNPRDAFGFKAAILSVLLFPSPLCWANTHHTLLKAAEFNSPSKIDFKTAPAPEPLGSPSPQVEIEEKTRARITTKSTIEQKEAVLDSLKEQLKINSEFLDAIEKKEKSTWGILERAPLQIFDLSASSFQIKDLTRQLDEIGQSHREYQARKEVIDQLIVAVDSHWTDQSLQPWLVDHLFALAKAGLVDANPNPSWRFYVYLALVLRQMADPRENPIARMATFMNFSSVLNPKNPADFLASRDYTNANESLSAKTIRKEDLGEYLEKRNKEINQFYNTRTAKGSGKPSFDHRIALKRKEIDIRFYGAEEGQRHE